MSQTAVIGIDIGKNSFHVVGHDDRGVICCVRMVPSRPALSEIPDIRIGQRRLALNWSHLVNKMPFVDRTEQTQRTFGG